MIIIMYMMMLIDGHYIMYKNQHDIDRQWTNHQVMLIIMLNYIKYE